MEHKRVNTSQYLWHKTAGNHTINILNKTEFEAVSNRLLKEFQEDIVRLIKEGYDGRSVHEVWNFPAALMFCLSVFTMIGYGNMVPRTPWGKGATVMYALFGIPLYILYFLNMGKVTIYYNNLSFILR